MMFCGNCGASLEENTGFCQKCGFPVGEIQEPTESAEEPPIKKKRRFKKWILLGSVLLVTVIAACVCIKINQARDFELLADGTLCYTPTYWSSAYWGYSSPEIPREYDGKAVRLDEKYNGMDLKYDGKLRHFLRFYSWLVTDQQYRERVRYIYCSDYTLYIANKNRDEVAIEYPDGGGAKVIHVNYSLYEGDRRVKSFETYYDLWEWLN